RHASRPDEPRHGDQSGCRRLAPLDHRRAGRERGQRTDGRALPDAWGIAQVSTYLIKGASIVGAAATDLLIRDGVVAAVGRDARTSGAEVVDAAGLVALPGLVDLHTHLREPGREDAETVETGSRAAALGGYTAVCAMANTDPVADTAGVVEQVWRLGQAAGLVDVQPVGAVTLGLAGERLAHLPPH